MDVEVTGYDVDMYFLDEGAMRSIRLEGTDGEGTDAVAYLHFYANQRYADRAQLTVAPDLIALVVDLQLAEYEQLYHLLQTEKPVYLYAEYERTDEPVMRVTSMGVTTELEMVGEGFEDLTP